MTLQTFDIKYHSMSISMRCSFFHIVKHSFHIVKYSLIQPVANYWLDDSKKAEGEPAPLTDEEEVVKYWKNSQIQK